MATKKKSHQPRGNEEKLIGGDKTRKNKNVSKRGLWTDLNYLLDVSWELRIFKRLVAASTGHCDAEWVLGGWMSIISCSLTIRLLQTKHLRV